MTDRKAKATAVLCFAQDDKNGKPQASEVRPGACMFGLAEVRTLLAADRRWFFYWSEFR